MRPIKFRAWDGFKMVSPDYIDRNGQAWWKENSIPTYSNIIQQFTGLTDKNGKDEIYEKDIVLLKHWQSSDLFDYSKPFLVDYYEGEIVFKQGDYFNFKGSLTGKLSITKIGNLFEHPHLLNTTS